MYPKYKRNNKRLKDATRIKPLDTNRIIVYLHQLLLFLFNYHHHPLTKRQESLDLNEDTMDIINYLPRMHVNVFEKW